MRPSFKQVHCPFLRTVLSAPDAPAWDEANQQMSVADLVNFVRAQPGNGNLDRVVRFFAVTNHGPGNRAQRFIDLLGGGSRFSTNLVGSDGDHGGGSHIYNPESREFDGAQFDAFTRHSSDGKAMSIADLGAAIADANRRNHGTPSDALQSAVEFALLSIVVGDDHGSVPIAGMRQLYEANTFPEGARENLGTRTAEQWFALSARIVEATKQAAAKNGHPLPGGEHLDAGLRMFFAPLFS